MRRRRTYFIAYCLRDVTLIGALQTRNLTPRQLQYGSDSKPTALGAG